MRVSFQSAELPVGEISIRRRNEAAHMRYMICMDIFLRPPGLTLTLGYWFNVRQMTGATVSLAAIEACLTALILYNLRGASIRDLTCSDFLVTTLRPLSEWLSGARSNPVRA